MANFNFNKITLGGRLTADPELKQTQSGQSVTTFSIGVSRKFAKNGECDFIPIVAWAKSAEFVCQWFKKGNPILICGQIQIRSWTDKQGHNYILQSGSYYEVDADGNVASAAADPQ